MKLAVKLAAAAAALTMSAGICAADYNSSAGINLEGDTEAGGPGCEDAGVLSAGMASAICWDCLFPIIVSNGPMTADRIDRMPDRAASSTSQNYCYCSDSPGVSGAGIITSFWEPARLMEIVRKSGCSSVLGGVRFPFNRLNQGTYGRLSQDTEGTGGLSFAHYHYYSFPVLSLLDAWIPAKCNPGGFMDLDVVYLSEIDPTWNNDEIAFFTHPEAALMTSPTAVSSCIEDAFSADEGKPVDDLYWCAGAWGTLFPVSGKVLSREGIMKTASLLSVRALYELHYRGIEWRSMGIDAMCGGTIDDYLPKSQYRFQVFHPVAETDDNHALGEPVRNWGEGRVIPAVGEDPVFLIWRWLDCCATPS